MENVLLERLKVDVTKDSIGKKNWDHCMKVHKNYLVVSSTLCGGTVNQNTLENYYFNICKYEMEKWVALTDYIKQFILHSGEIDVAFIKTQFVSFLTSGGDGLKRKGDARPLEW